MKKKNILLFLFLIFVSATFVSAADCLSEATVSVHFNKAFNSGSGNLYKRIFVGSTAVEFKEDEKISLSKNGKFITDPNLVENVPGISLQRVDGGVRLLLFGGSYSAKEILAAEIIFENAKIINFNNDWSRASTYPYMSNNLEQQGDGKYKLTNINQDEVFPNIGTNNASWYSTVGRDNDGFFLYIKCEKSLVTCSKDSDCGADGYVSNPLCLGNNITRIYQSFKCNNPGTIQSTCSVSNSTVVVEECSYKCSNDKCVQPSCGNNVLDTGEECDDGNTISGDGCSAGCKKEGDYIYVVPYVGDIDGAVSDDWFFFYGKIAGFYETNKIQGGFSFYPATIQEGNAEFSTAFKKMYLSEYIELIQKGYDGSDIEMKMDQLSYEEQKEIIKKGIDTYKAKMKILLGIDDTKPLITYDQIGARFTEDTKKALEELGFKFYFDVYVGDGLNAVYPTESFDVIQYGVSFTQNGDAGKETKFKTPDDIIKEIKGFSRVDVPITKIGGHLVIPLFVHQQDFESNNGGTGLDNAKWDVYTTTLLTLKADPNIRLVNPKQVYELGHGPLPPDPKPPEQNESGSCQFAKSASATSESNPNSLAVYATGKPDASSSGECSKWSGKGYTWAPSNWNIKASLTLTYETPVYVSNLTVFGDYDVCWSRIRIKDSKTGGEKVILDKDDETCVFKKELDNSFLADTVILETCGWGWSATDAVELCGIGNKTVEPPEPPEPPQQVANVTVCTWKDCKKGAVSVSVDDYYTSCASELEAQGYRGTYYLTDTTLYTPARWKEFNDLFNKGHELGTHMSEHWCIEISDTKYIKSIDDNIKQITQNTDAKKEDIVTYAYPCGFVVEKYKDILKKNWNFLAARGYYHNELEDATPKDFFDLKSYNSHDYPGGNFEPPSYFGVVDSAEKNIQWFNLVLHNECTDDGVISSLPSKNVWVDTIGNVVRYIILRDAAVISDYSEVGNEIKFKVKVDDAMNSAHYSQSLTLQVPVGLNKVSKVEVGNKEVGYRFFESSNMNYVVFEVDFPINKNVMVTKT